MEGSARAAGHDAHNARFPRQRALAFRREQALGRQPQLELLQRFEQRAAACRAHLVDHELQAPARRPNRGLPRQLQACPLIQVSARAQRVHAVHHALDDRVFRLILEAEVDVAARGTLQRADLALDPQANGCLFDRAT